MIIDIVKVILPAVLAFGVGVLITPFLTTFLYRHRMWKRKAGKTDSHGKETQVFNELHKTRETGTPRLGGGVIWAASLITIVGIWLVAQLTDTPVLDKLDFLSRGQTWIPLSTLLIGAGLGLVDDVMEIRGSTSSRIAGGLSLPARLAVIGLIGLGCGAWFFVKLNVASIGIPFSDPLMISWGIIPLFAVVMIALYASGVIDGIDGLAGGVFTIIFLAYAGIAFYQEQINLAAFCAMIAGATLAFLWFNIPPARFYMSETGSMALTITLAVVAFTADTLAGTGTAGKGTGLGVFVLPIVALPLVLTVASNLVQVAWKRLFGKKLLQVAPIHHHFEAIGWPPYKVTMRYWIIGIMAALLGMIIALIG